MKPHVGLVIQHCNLVIANDILLNDAVVIVVRECGKIFTEHGVSIATVKSCCSLSVMFRSTIFSLQHSGRGKCPFCRRILMRV